MQKYECIFILRTDLPEPEMGSHVDRIRSIVSEHGGEITLENHWGVRKLEFEIEFQNKGDYMLLRFVSGPQAVAEIDRYLRLDDKVLRHLVVRDEEWEDRNRAAMAKRRQAHAEDDVADNQD